MKDDIFKVFALYYDRFDDATTSKALYDNDIEHIVLCHNNKSKFTNIHTKYLIETHEPKGIQHNFNYGLEVLGEGKWGVFISDDYLHTKKYVNGKFEPSNLKHQFDVLRDVIPKADKAGIKLIGFSSTGNPFYSKKKFGKFGLVDGRFLAIKKTAFRFHHDICTIPDYYATAYHLKMYGGNLVINHVYSNFERYGSKGLGSIDDRIKDKLHDVKLLLKLFPDHIRIKQKPGEPLNSHVVIKR